MQPKHTQHTPPVAGREVDRAFVDAEAFSQPLAALLPEAAGAQPRQKQPHEALLCVSGDFESVACFDPRSLVLKHEIPTPKKNFCVMSIPPEDGREEELIAVGESSGTSRAVLLYHPHQGGSPIRKLSVSHSGSVYGLACVSPRLVVSGSRDHELVVSDVNSGEKLMDLKDAPEYMTRATSSSQEEGGALHQRGNGFVFVGGGDFDGDKSLRHDDLGRSERTNEVVKKFEGHDDWAWGLSYSAEKNLLFSSSSDSTLRIWSVQDGTCLEALRLASRSYSLLYDPKKRLIFCGVFGGIIEVWDYRQTKERVRKINHPSVHPTKEDELHIYDMTQIDAETYASIGDVDCSVSTWTDGGKILATAKTMGENFGMCIIIQTQSGMERAAQEERIAFLLSFSSAVWDVEVRACPCCIRMTHAMMGTMH